MSVTNHTCETCQRWRRRWASRYEQKQGYGGCAEVRFNPRLRILDNSGRVARFGWLETPKDFACIFWKARVDKAKAKAQSPAKPKLTSTEAYDLYACQPG